MQNEFLERNSIEATKTSIVNLPLTSTSPNPDQSSISTMVANNTNLIKRKYYTFV